MVTATKPPNSYENVRKLALDQLLNAEDLASLPDDGNRYEIIGGQLIVSPSPTYRHQRVSFKLTSVLDAYLSTTGNGQAVAAPMDVHLSINDVVQPDLLVALNERSDIIEDRGIGGAPDLVVEVLSPSSISNDFLRKPKLYERFGVREYWIVNPENETVSVQTLDGERYAPSVDCGRNDTLTSAVLDGFTLDLALISPDRQDKSAQKLAGETATAAAQ
jgi:Uma2 family endonuclease